MDGALWERVDQAVCAAYGLDEAQRQALIDTHLRPVSKELPLAE